jgi:hypothetical protein
MPPVKFPDHSLCCGCRRICGRPHSGAGRGTSETWWRWSVPAIRLSKF